VRKNLGFEDEPGGPGPAARSRRRLAIRLVLLGILLGPVLYEVVLTWYARWGAIIGQRTAVATPLLNRFGSFLRTSRALITYQFSRVPWRSDYVIFIGVTSCLACMALLRGRQSH
jgi:hypothetical protein